MRVVIFVRKCYNVQSFYFIYNDYSASGSAVFSTPGKAIALWITILTISTHRKVCGAQSAWKTLRCF